MDDNRYRKTAVQIWKWPVIILLVGGVFFSGGKIIYQYLNPESDMQTFNDCVEAGNLILETYPEQCISDGRTFVRPIAH